MLLNKMLDLTRPGKKTVNRAERGSLLWKYYILHRELEGKLEYIRMRLDGNYGVEKPISFCTTVMDRFEHLEKTYIKNIIDNAEAEQCEFILLNYNCPDARTDNWVRDKLLGYMESGRVKYYKFRDGTGKYRASHARNLAFRLASNEIICNVDVDNYLGSDFYVHVSALFRQDRIFLRGPIDRRGIAGRLCCNKKDWEMVGGYDERFVCWGVEDSDLDSRFVLAGLERKTILNEKFCRCILHEDSLRSRHYDMDTRTSYKFNGAILKNNHETGTINPNGDNFGRGRVQKNFNEYIRL